MEGRFDEGVCRSMWSELDGASEGGVRSFRGLTARWYRNLEEYATTGTVASGELPFAVQFCSPRWLPQLNEGTLVQLRAFFTRMVVDINGDQFLWWISSDEGLSDLRDELKTTGGFTPLTCARVAKPLRCFRAFVESIERSGRESKSVAGPALKEGDRVHKIKGQGVGELGVVTLVDPATGKIRVTTDTGTALISQSAGNFERIDVAAAEAEAEAAAEAAAATAAAAAAAAAASVLISF